MYTSKSDWVTLLHSRKLREHSQSAIMEKIKISIKKKKEKKSEFRLSTHGSEVPVGCAQEGTWTQEVKF